MLSFTPGLPCNMVQGRNNGEPVAGSRLADACGEQRLPVWSDKTDEQLWLKLPQC